MANPFMINKTPCDNSAAGSDLQRSNSGPPGGSTVAKGHGRLAVARKQTVYRTCSKVHSVIAAAATVADQGDRKERGLHQLLKLRS
jgi:hypothetical protein